jgi:hypothetical protein
MENGMLIGRNAEKSLPDTPPDPYHEKRDAYKSEILVERGPEYE